MLQYKIKENATLVNKLTNESIRGNIIKEDEIEGKSFWVVLVPPRTAPLRYYKDAWSLKKEKSK